MKTLIIITLNFCSLCAFSQEINDSTIRKLKISNFLTTTTVKVKTAYKTTAFTYSEEKFFDKKGRLERKINKKSNNEIYDRIEKLYYYDDSVVIKSQFSGYKNGRLDQKYISKYSYTYDSANRIISKSTETGDSRKKEVYHRDVNNLIDTTYYYNNDSSIYNEERRGSDFTYGKSLFLKKNKIDTWSSGQELKKTKECTSTCRDKWLSDTLCCTTTEFYTNKDTTFQTEKYYNNEWVTEVTKKVQSDNTTYEEDGRCKTMIFTKKNKLGLVVETQEHRMDIIQGYFYETITKYKYQMWK